MIKRNHEERKNVTESEVLERLKTLAPMLQQEYLENLLKRIEISPDVKIIASKKLAEIYTSRNMWSSAARVMTNAATSAEKFNTAQDLYMSAAALSIKAGDYLLADDNVKGALDAAAPSEKARIQTAWAEMYILEAATLDKTGKITKAVQVYERILKTNKDPGVTKRVKERLVVLYEKLGKIQDHMRMRDSLNNQ